MTWNDWVSTFLNVYVSLKTFRHIIIWCNCVMTISIVFFVFFLINIKEYRTGAIKNRQSREPGETGVHKTKTNKTQNTTQYVGHHYAQQKPPQKNTNNVKYYDIIIN